MEKTRKEKQNTAERDRDAVGSQPPAADELQARIAFLEEEIEQLRFEKFYRQSRQAPHDPGALTLAVDKYVRDTGDGWLTVLTSGTRTSIPSGLKVAVTSTANGRDYGTIKEGVLDGVTFDVTAGNLLNNYRRLSDLKIKVKHHSGSPVIIDGVSYDLDLAISYKENGTAKTAGPFPAKTYAADPLPYGIHDLEIADYPHPAGSGYGALGTVWFRIGHSGDRYLHPGRVSLGCMTCAPPNWSDVYRIVNAARRDSRSVGTLEFAQVAIAQRATKPSPNARKSAAGRKRT
ncbi:MULTISPECIES: hypothetical protein [Rhizobium/Agrobacterium group]|uniref:hypothetical protein n=1 Tax=Rhizobium/Agrobacterium group TaxID=227290 RepID=UPI0012E93233|nr:MULTISPECIES: hypothetical protein [Rhizobium/Agrobacterium group]MCF1475050.1 hypothetical protein [Allorhizobium ampelinum]MVA52736.1 hypothetical protein [Agrobacterium vitis]NSZ55461.1 hypothetical protein [Agrobacterium vitis]NTA34527.1 hypothetical protein [Agrobacterium vitis]